MVNPANVDLRTWTVQSSSPLRDGNYPSSARPGASQIAGLGTNLFAVHDYSQSREFTNIAKMARKWIVGVTGGTYDTGEYDLLTLDSNGYPTAFGGTGNHYKLFYAADVSLVGSYVFTYSGTGTFTGREGITVTSSAAGRIEFDLAVGNGWFEISGLGTGGNHPRDFVITLAADEGSTDTFTPEFLSSLGIYDTIRFMDWTRTNNNTYVTDWADRGTVDYCSWGLVNGVPWEIAFRLCNELVSDCWICIPHLATDAFVTSLATLALSELDAGRNVYVEYSNEVWNSQFGQATWVQSQGVTEYASGDSFADRINWFGKRTAEIGVLFKAVWTGANEARVTTVLGAQAGNTWTATTALACTLDARAPCSDDIDAIAIAPYFGASIGNTAYETTVQGWDLTDLFSEIDTGTLTTSGSLTAATDLMDSYVTVANANSKQLLCYEGGQHLVGVGVVQDNTTITALFASANRDSRMNDRYDTYLAHWKSLNKGVFCNFNHIGSYSKFGNWGSYEYLGQPTTPKRQALEDY